MSGAGGAGGDSGIQMSAIAHIITKVFFSTSSLVQNKPDQPFESHFILISRS